jgi:tRNA modification GTPase
VVAVTKLDLSAGYTVSAPEGVAVICLSSVTGEGLGALSDAIAGLFPMPSVPAGEILTNSRQADAVRRALASMNAAAEAVEAGFTPDIVLTETEEAMEALGGLTGRSVGADVTERIFSRFCVGK